MRSRHKRGEDAECDSRGKPGGPSFWGPARRRTGASSQALTGAPSGEAEQPSPDARSADSEALEEAPRAGSANIFRDFMNTGKMYRVNIVENILIY